MATYSKRFVLRNIAHHSMLNIVDGLFFRHCSRITHKLFFVVYTVFRLFRFEEELPIYSVFLLRLFHSVTSLIILHRLEHLAHVILDGLRQRPHRRLCRAGLALGLKYVLSIFRALC